jgi:hypothetical protein
MVRMTCLKTPKALSFLLAFLVVGCASSNRNAYKKLRKDISDKKIDSAISLVKSDKFYPEERSKLVKLLELANLQHIKGDYYQSLKSFDKAQDLSDKLFTVSISKKALSAVTNNNMDNYYGEIYERSIIRFYQALNHFMLYQKGEYEAHTLTKKVKDGKKDIVKTKKVPLKVLSQNEKRSHLTGARASLLEWDSLLDNYTKSMKGDSTYKADLSSRIFGAFIHEQMGSTTDRNIAIGLYKDAKKVLFRYYNLYPSFNEKHKEFAKNFSKLHKMSEKSVQSKFVKATAYAKNLTSFINTRIKDLKNRKKKNVTIVMQQGYITEKSARLIHFPLPISSGAGNKGMFGFAGKMLANTRGTLPSITFELPEVKQKKLKKSVVLIVKDKAGKIIKTTKAVVMNPISDIAFQSLDNKIVSTNLKIGARVAAKHVAALLAAYEVSKKTGEFAASMMYAVSNKSIAASEQADLRFWSTLPHTLRIGSLELKAGEYSLFIKTVEGKKSTETKWGAFTVEKKVSKLINLNIM